MKYRSPLVSLELENQSINGNATAVDSTVSLYLWLQVATKLFKKAKKIQVT